MVVAVPAVFPETAADAKAMVAMMKGRTAKETAAKRATEVAVTVAAAMVVTVEEATAKVALGDAAKPVVMGTARRIVEVRNPTTPSRARSIISLSAAESAVARPALQVGR